MEKIPLKIEEQATVARGTVEPWISRVVVVSPEVARRNNQLAPCRCEYWECSGDCDCDGDTGTPNPG